MTVPTCTACDASASCVIQYQRTEGSDMPRTPFCAVHDRELHKTLRPLSNPSIKMWLYEKLRLAPGFLSEGAH